MNFSKRQNEFCDIPGFDASKGERIIKALQKLWAKIQYLEQNRKTETKSRSEASCSSKEEDLTLTDVQYKLLLLQLQYVRSLLKSKSHPNNEAFQSRISEDEQKCTLFASGDRSHSELTNKPASTEIYAVDYSVADLNSAKKSSSIEEKSKNVQVTSDNQFSRFKHSTEETTALYQRTVPSSSKPHYHLKLDDVPFILGASSTASHSVVANLQNIIGRMKLHNKALCGPKPNVTRSSFTNTHSTNVSEKHSTEENPKSIITRSNVDNLHSAALTEKNFGENSQDATKLLNDLTRDLTALAAKQQKLVESIDASQIKSHGPEMNSTRNAQDHENKINYKHVENNDSETEVKLQAEVKKVPKIKVKEFVKHNDDSKAQRSHSESEVKLHAEVKKIPKIKEKEFVKHPKQSACDIQSQSSNLSIMDRRKLLRSLQNFKKHLSEEDISWN